jgi:hypothetical protein
MNSVRLSGILAASVAAVCLLAGCGSSTASGPAGASVAPAGSSYFLAIDTSFDSAQWDAARALVDKFPARDRAVRWLLDELDAHGVDFDRDVKPALGPETDIVGVAGQPDRYVVLAKPDDPDKLRALLAKSQLVSRVVDGWTVISDDLADVDWFGQARGSGTLENTDAFQDVMGDLPQDALLRLYVARGLDRGIPPALGHLFPSIGAPSIGLSLTAAESGLRVQGTVKDGASELAPDNFEAELPDEVPAGVLLYLDANDLESSLSALRDLLAQVAPDFDRDLARAEASLGVSLEEDVFPLFSRETALYVRPGFLIPEVTLVTDVEDEQVALATAGKLVDALKEYLPSGGPTRVITIDGVKATELPLAVPVSLYYAAFDGHLVVTTSRDGIAALREDGDRLADDSDFREALDRAGVPDETNGFAYVNIHDAIPYVLGFVKQGGGGGFPPVLGSNIEPVENAVVYGSKDGKTLRFAAFLAVD